MLKNKHKKEEVKNENNNTENPNNLENIENEAIKINEETDINDLKLLRKISDLEQANEELKDKYLRIVAEYDNYRRRTAKEKLELSGSIKSNVIFDFLPVVDDMDRALSFLKSNNNTEDFAKNIEGINLIAEKFHKFLTLQGVDEIDAKDKQFDVDLHEAVTKFQVQDESQKGKVIDVIQNGYKMNDKVIRFAKVVVGE